MTTDSAPDPEAPGETSTPVRDFAGAALCTRRLELRPWAEADIDAITAACQDPEIQRYVPVPVPYERSDAEAYVRRTVPLGRAEGTDVVFGVYSVSDGLPVAAVGLHRIRHLDNPCGGVGEIGYWTAPEARGRGYMTEAVREVCRWGFADLGLARIEWLAVAGNAASWRVVEKLGFTREGTLRAYTVHRGERVDMWIASLLRAEAVGW